MGDEPLRTLLRQSNDRAFRFTFADRAEMTTVVISDSHVDTDDTLIVVRVDAIPDEPSWQVHLSDIVTVAAVGGTILYDRTVDDRQ